MQEAKLRHRFSKFSFSDNPQRRRFSTGSAAGRRVLEALLLRVRDGVIIGAERLSGNPDIYSQRSPFPPLSSAHVAIHPLAAPLRTEASQATMDRSVRIQLLLEELTDTLMFGESRSRGICVVQRRSGPEEPNANCPPSLDGSVSTVSTDSGDGGLKSSDASSQLSAPATSVTSVSAVPAGFVPPLTLDQQLQQMALADANYYLQCEFVFTGCNERFHPSNDEDWIAHTIEHLTHSIPSKSVCIFCDTKFDCSETRINPTENWRLRMDHIHDHFRDGLLFECARPDFFVLKHMSRHGLLSREKHDYLTAFSERPLVDGLKPFGWEPDERKVKRERGLRVEHDLNKERRSRRKMAAQN